MKKVDFATLLERIKMSYGKMPLRKLVENCSACSDTHEISFRKLKQPIIINKKVCTHKGRCPKSNKVVFMRMR